MHFFCQIALVEFKLINSQLIMAPLTKKELRITIANFYKLHHPKGKFFTYSNFKQPIKDKIITKKTHKKNQKIRNITNMFRNLKNKIHQANEFGLTSLL